MQRRRTFRVIFFIEQNTAIPPYLILTTLRSQSEALARKLDRLNLDALGQLGKTAKMGSLGLY